MITTTEIGAILAKCAGYRPDKTPQPSELVIRAWAEHFADFPHLDASDALEAVRVFHRDPHDRMIQPADISKIAREIRRDRAQREPDAVREARQSALDARLVDAIETFPATPPVAARTYTRPSHRTGDGPNPLSVRCPWCHAGEYRPCQTPGTNVRMLNPHPSRIEAAS